jgi:hypothetical protein
MKLKYKKMIIMVTMCTMGIGMVTFSMNGKSKDSSTKVEESSNKKVADNAEKKETTEVNEVFSAAIATAAPTPTETPVVEEVNLLEKDANKEINTLITSYLKAKLTYDIDKFKPLVNDISLVNIKEIKRKTKYIEKYRNLSCYTKKGPEEGSYIVYAYHEVKFKSIDTLAPTMTEFYVETDENGKLYIYMGEIDKATEQYLNNARESEDVMDLIYSVNDKLDKAKKKDSALADFNNKLEESTKSVSKKN